MTNHNAENNENLARLNKPLAFVIFMLGMGFAVLNLQAAQSEENTSLALTLLYAAVAFVSLFITAYWVFDAYQTEVTEGYVRKGKVIARWEDVSSAKANDFSIALKVGSKTLVINYFAYSSPETLSAKVTDILHSHGVAC